VILRHIVIKRYAFTLMQYTVVHELIAFLPDANGLYDAFSPFDTAISRFVDYNNIIVVDIIFKIGYYHDCVLPRHKGVCPLLSCRDITAFIPHRHIIAFILQLRIFIIKMPCR